MRFKRHLSYAMGYLELGLVAEAAEELRRIPDINQDATEVLLVRMAVLQEQQDWPALAGVSENYVRRAPKDAGGWVTWAYAVRRATCLASAERILLEAEKHHPTEPTIQFNLGCYACQRGDLPVARQRVDRAIALDAKFAASAKTDPDLAPLGGAGATDCQLAP